MVDGSGGDDGDGEEYGGEDKERCDGGIPIIHPFSPLPFHFNFGSNSCHRFYFMPFAW